MRVLVTLNKLHLLRFQPRLPQFQLVKVLRGGELGQCAVADVTLSHADLRQSELLDLHFLRFHRDSRSRHLCGITSRGHFLLITPQGRIVLSSPLISATDTVPSATVVPVTTMKGYTKRLFVVIDPGKVAMFTKAQLATVIERERVEGAYTVLTFDGCADALCWTRIRTIFDTREVLILAHNSKFTVSQYTFLKEDEVPDIGLKDVLRASISSVASRWLRRSEPGRLSPSTSALKLLSEIADPKRTFDRVIAIGDLTATLDKAGRVWVIDTNSFIIIRMLKGYRGGDIAWHKTAEHVNLAVYLPSRRLLDVWRMRTGLRSTRIRLAEDGRLLASNDRAYFLSESGKLLLFDQSDASIRAAFFYDNSADPLTSATRHQRDQALISAYPSHRKASTLAAISVENLALLFPFIFGSSTRSGEEYLELISVAIAKVEALQTHPNRLVLFKTIKADSGGNAEMTSVETLLEALHNRKKVCMAYCDIVKGMKDAVDGLVDAAVNSDEVRQFLDMFHLSLQFDDEFVDAHGEGEIDKTTFENSTYQTSWRQFYKLVTSPPSPEDSQNLSLLVSQLLLCDYSRYEQALKRVGKTRGAAVEMFFSWVSACDAKQLAFALAHPAAVQEWLQSLLSDYSSQVVEFARDCHRLCGVYVLLRLCEKVEGENPVWREMLGELESVKEIGEVFAEAGMTPELTIKGISAQRSLSRAVAEWELAEHEAARVFGLESPESSHLECRLLPIAPDRLKPQLSPPLYAIHRADIVLTKAEPISGAAVETAFKHLMVLQDPLLLSAALYYLYTKHVAKALFAAFEDLPGVSDLPQAVTPWLETLEKSAQAEGSFLAINTDSLLSSVTTAWLDIKSLVLNFNLQQMRKVLMISRLTPEEATSVSAVVEKVFALSSSDIEELVYLNLPLQAISTDAESATRLFNFHTIAQKEDARLLSSILTTDEESLKIITIRRLLEEGNDPEAEQLISEVRDTIKLSETLYAVARMRIGYIVQTLQDGPEYALLLSNFPRKLMKMRSEDSSIVGTPSLKSAKDLLSQAIRYMDAKYSVHYKEALELEDAYQSLYKVASAE